MIDLVNFVVVGAAFFVAAASPGPATLAVAAVSMSQGRPAGLTFGFGLSVGLMFWGLIAATGLGAVLQTSSEMLIILKLIGGAYLIWLAFLSGRSAMTTRETEIQFKNSRRNFIGGLLLNLSNPKAVLAWLAVLTLGSGESSTVLNVVFATLTCSAIGVLIYSGYAVAFSTTHAMTLYTKFRRWIDWIVSGLFAIAGLGLIKSALSR